MKKILYSSQYIPSEWISAHGLEPVRPYYKFSEAYEGEGEGICPYAEMMYQNSLSGDIDAAVFTTRCDQMRRISELCRLSGENSFLMNIPATWQNPVSVEIYKNELIRLSRFLTEISGKDVSYEKFKNLLIKKQLPVEKKRGKRIALMGGPDIGSDSDLINILGENCANITLDATEQGEITKPNIDFENLEKDPVVEIANSHFKEMPDIAKRPNTQFYKKTAEIIKKRKVEGIIVRLYPWCDLWHAEVQRIKEYFGLPLLQITADVNVEFEKDKRLQTRLKAFLEMI